MLLLASLLACEVAVPSIVILPSQHARQIALTRPTLEVDADFTQIRGIRELSDGRFLVSDRVEQRLVLGDPRTGRLTGIGRVGSGPNEYRLPTTLLPLPGDSTLLVDEGNQRLAVIGPDGRLHRSFGLRLPGIGFPLGARGVDDQGRYYLAIPAWVLGRGGVEPDSIPIVRFDPVTTKVDTIGRVQPSPRPRVKGKGPGYSAGLPMYPFAGHDTWTVDSRGTLITVRAAGYRVEFATPGRRVVRGRKAVVTPVKVTEKDKIEFTRAFLESSSMSGRNGDGTLSLVPAEMRTDEAIRRIVDENEFPEVMGPFTSAPPLIDRLGRVWVQRARHMHEPQLWDVFDRAGRHTLEVRLPAARRLIAMGSSGVWVAATDEDGLEHVERYAVPNA
jgi:hypothetical protein